MKTLALILIVSFLTAIATWAADAPGNNSRLLHVVSLKFKDSATQEQIKEVEVAFRALKDKIPGIVSLEWGTNVSPEKHDKGFTHCWVLSFKSAKDRDAYLVHPEHKKFGALLGPVLGDVMVIDFWSRQ